MIPPELQKLHDAHKAAAEALCRGAEEAYPVGTIVAATLGGNRITGEVISHAACWWYGPGHFAIRNLKTGKVRGINPFYESADVSLIHTPLEA